MHFILMHLFFYWIGKSKVKKRQHSEILSRMLYEINNDIGAK